jgi:hypothetical protein
MLGYGLFFEYSISLILNSSKLISVEKSKSFLTLLPEQEVKKIIITNKDLFNLNPRHF